MIEISFSEFLRNGGNGVCHVKCFRHAVESGSARISTKDAIPNLTELSLIFEDNLERAVEAVVTNLPEVTRSSFDVPIQRDDLADISEDYNGAREEWERRLGLLWSQESARPAHFRALRQTMEAEVLRAFAGAINERMQRGLGIEHYVWLSADNNRVRPGHAGRHGEIYGWDEPPEGECAGNPNLRRPEIGGECSRPP